MKTNFDLVKDRSVVMDGIGMTEPYKIFPTVKDFVDFLNLTVEEKILDDVEKRYIKNIIRPFRNQVISVRKSSYSNKYEYIVITYHEDAHTTERRIYLPNFKTNTMYKGMSLEKHYTLEELGITFKN
jgi:hypothetical protein